MPVATATVQVDDDGVVRGLRTMQSEFREVGDAADEAGEGVEGFEESTGSAVGRMERYNQSVEEGFGLTRQFANAQDQLAQGGTDVVQSMDRQADAIERVKDQQKQLSTASSKYNQIVFSTGDLVQDLQFGLRGAGNNIAFLAENFAEAQGSAGGFTSTLKGVFGALKGPAGIILAIQALIALGPKLREWFQGQEENAEGFQKALEDAAGQLLKFEDSVAGFEVEGLEQAEKVLETLRKRRKEREQTVETLGELAAVENLTKSQIEAVSEFTAEEAKAAKERLGLAGANKEAIKERLAEEQRSLNALDQSVTRAESLVQSRRAALEVQQAMEDSGADPTTDPEEQNAAAVEWETTLREIHKIQNRILSPDEEPSFSADLVDNMGQMVGSVAEAETALQKGLIDSVNGANQVISMLDTKFQSATSDQQRERIDNLRQSFKNLRDEMRKTGEDSEEMETTMGGVIDSMDQQATLANALSQNFVQFGKAVGQGERVMDAFGDAALGVLASVGTAMGKQMIAQGSALLASALIPGLQGNAAAGAKLIAAGSALVAASSALSGLTQSGGGGGSQSGEADDSRRPEGGGRSETGVSAPGRQTGGPVRGGRFYETHGLGRREFFMPERDGQIVTANQMGAMGRSREVRVRNEVSSRLGVEDAQVDFDVGELRFRLNELETKVEQVS